MELPAVRQPRVSWTRRSQRLLRQISPFSPSQREKLAQRARPGMAADATSAGCETHCPLGRGSHPNGRPHGYGHSPSPHHGHGHAANSPSTHKAGQHAHSATVSVSHSLLHHLHRRRPDKSPPRKLVLPHTITERHGGQDLWVTAPVLATELQKQGFRWRKKWKTRFVELNGRVLSYYEVGDAPRKLRQSVHLTADALLVDVDELTFSLTPSPGERAWIFRASDPPAKLRWCKALHDCVDILTWLQHYEVGDVLGVGGNGIVRSLVDMRDGRRFAVKIVDASKFKNRASVVSEVEILRSITNDIRHPNLVQIHKVYEEQERIYLILDLCEGGELYDSIVQRGCFSERDAASIMQQLLSALRALHQHNILHLDLKPENILLSSKDPADAKIVLTDFGLARMVTGKANPLAAGTTMAGTVGYIAPEVIAAHQYTEAADVFGAGVILFILLVGYPPFHGDSEVEILLKIARGDFQFHADDWTHISTPAKELVARMLEVRAPDRITVDEALHHPWLVENGADASRMLDKTVQRMQQFNFVRKSENMACCMATMLTEDSEADYLALVDVKAIDTLIRQLTPTGSDRIVVDKALMLARHLGISPYVDVKSFVAFLDRNDDGFIDALDFCDGVRAMRDCDEAFVKIIFAAMVHMIHDGDSARASSATKTLTIADLAIAFDKLSCPVPLSDDFFKYMAARPKQRERPIGEADFIELVKTFRFLPKLFILKARRNFMVMTRTASSEKLPQLADEIRESLMLD